MRGHESHQSRRSRNVSGQRPDDFDPGLGNDFADEGQADIDLAFGEEFHRASAPLSDFDFRLHRIGDAELLQRLVEAHTGGRATRSIGIGNGL